jgi:hypothetical protein
MEKVHYRPSVSALTPHVILTEIILKDSFFQINRESQISGEPNLCKLNIAETDLLTAELPLALTSTVSLGTESGATELMA